MAAAKGTSRVQKAENDGRIAAELAALRVRPFRCPSCDLPVSDGSFYCRDLCQQEAKFVRRYRVRRACCSDRGTVSGQSLRFDTMGWGLAFDQAGSSRLQRRASRTDVRPELPGMPGEASQASKARTPPDWAGSAAGMREVSRTADRETVLHARQRGSGETRRRWRVSRAEKPAL
jgi:hypothetical protein